MIWHDGEFRGVIVPFAFTCTVRSVTDRSYTPSSGSEDLLFHLIVIETTLEDSPHVTYFRGHRCLLMHLLMAIPGYLGT